MNATHFFRTLTLAVLVVGCEPAAAPSADVKSQPTSLRATPDAGAQVAVDTSSFKILKGATTIGTETWNVSHAADGSTTNDFTATVGPITLKGELRFAADFSIETAKVDEQQGAESSTLTLARDPASATKKLVLTTKQAGKPTDVVTETESSQLFVAKPSMAGLMPICMRAAAQDESLHMFPGAVVRVVSVKPLGPTAREIVLDFAGNVRIEAACEDRQLAVIRVPIQNVSYVRSGAEPVLTAMQTLDERKKPAIPDSLVEEDRTVDVPAKGTDVAATLACSFVHPKDLPATKLPAVIFVTGSGPEDRDEDTVGPGGLKLAIFKTMAIRLASAGIASLRCDDRGTAKSTGDYAAATLDTFVRDARATYDALRKEKIVDASRVGIVGHSEGGIVAPRVVVEDKSVHALFLMAAPGENLGDIIAKQVKRELQGSGASDDDIAKRIAASTAVMNAVRDGKPFPDILDDAQKASMEKQRGWLHSELVNDPLAVIQKVKCPVFLAQGGKDEQVPPEDADALLKTLQKAGNKRAQTKMYPALNHLFAPTKTGSMADYSDPDLNMSDEFLGDAVTFLTTALKR